MDLSHDLKRHIIKRIDGLDDPDMLKMIYQILRENDISGTAPPNRKRGR